MPIWIMPIITGALGALVQPLVTAIVRSLLDPKALCKLMLSAGEKLVKHSDTDLDDVWFADFKARMETELANHIK